MSSCLVVFWKLPCLQHRKCQVNTRVTGGLLDEMREAVRASESKSQEMASALAHAERMAQRKIVCVCVCVCLCVCVCGCLRVRVHTYIQMYIRIHTQIHMYHFADGRKASEAADAQIETLRMQRDSAVREVAELRNKMEAMEKRCMKAEMSRAEVSQCSLVYPHTLVVIFPLKFQQLTYSPTLIFIPLFSSCYRTHYSHSLDFILLVFLNTLKLTCIDHMLHVYAEDPSF
jgi:hypothetical protein